MFIASHLGLDFLNTRFQVGRAAGEYLNSDEDVFSWLRDAGLMEDVAYRLPVNTAGTLLKCALALREGARELVERRKQNQTGRTALLNRFLALDRRVFELNWQRGCTPTLEVAWQPASIDELLGPVATSFARLIADADFKLVRKCEYSDCERWFYDHTKGHNRRWCSMILCGYRAKALKDSPH